jgi:TRAP-type C4-dicarboxylate transport system permease small subunit
MTENVLTLLPPKARRVLYIIYGLLSLALTGAAAVFTMSPYPVPWWIPAGLAGLGALIPFFSAIAASNVKPQQIAEPKRALDAPEPQIYPDEGGEEMYRN